ncbi:hypothetical protein [Thalassobacillus pellis]|uniref:hypothetical protein n=1 Tax=Thalassobacillus pellis TaxID=748008 RepID=UPI00195F5BA8|nr:hypothetical protein [Thalassobacillus pellis]MBM7553466.1 uncharacterized membrane protein HdeD (DUF308 family) [Thalassobacillus pellis]
MLTTAKLEITIGILTIVTGLLYVFKVFGETEAIVHTWGILAVFIGVIIICLGVFSQRITDLLAIILLFFLLLFQTPAIALWFIFHGSGISDGSPQSDLPTGCLQFPICSSFC